MIDESNVKLTKTRHLGLWFALFGGFIAVAATFIILYALGILSDGSGYIALVAKVYSDEITYNEGISCSLYFQGNSFSVGGQTTNATGIYSDALKKAYMQTEAKTVYPQYASLAYLNSHLGEDVKVDDYVYNVLKDAYAKTKEDNNYSIFAGPLYEEYDRLCSIRSSGSWVNDPDPLYDEAQASYMAELASYINDEANFTLTFKEDNVIFLDISPAYKAFREANEITSPVASLNLLRQAYMIKDTAKALEEAGYVNGFLSYPQYGIGLTLKETPSLSHGIYGLRKGKVAEPLAVSIKGQTAFAKAVRLNLGQTKFPSRYTVSKDGTSYYRSPCLSLKTGLPCDYLLSSYLFEEKGDVVELALLSASGFGIEDEASLESFLTSIKGKSYVYNRKDKDDTFFISSSLQESIVAYAQDGYSIVYQA